MFHLIDTLADQSADGRHIPGTATDPGQQVPQRAYSQGSLQPLAADETVSPTARSVR